eukprot:6302637-Amphidinium_carterae.1
MSASEKVKFFHQWQLHREGKEPLKWTTAFASTISEKQVSTMDFRKRWMNARQILKHYGMEHLVGDQAGKMLKDILYQQSVKHSYENQCRVSIAANRDLDEERGCGKREVSPVPKNQQLFQSLLTDATKDILHTSAWEDLTSTLEWDVRITPIDQPARSPQTQRTPT